MNHSVYKLIVTVLVLVIIIGGGMLLYRNLGQNIDLGEAVPTETAPQNPAPDVTVTDGEGNEVKLSDFRGKGVVLNFWASWCGPCKAEMPHFQEAYEQHGEDVHFLMVNMAQGFGDTRDDAQKLLDDGGYTFPVYFDDDMDCAYGYGVSGIPMTIFIDKNGEIVSAKSGMIAAADLERRILTIAG